MSWWPLHKKKRQVCRDAETVQRIERAAEDERAAHRDLGEMRRISDHIRRERSQNHFDELMERVFGGKA